MNYASQITVQSKDLPPCTISIDNWQHLVETARRHLHEDMSEWQCLKMYGVCVPSIISQTAWHYAEMFVHLQGISRIQTPSQYYRTPAKYMDVVRILTSELERHNVKEDGDQH